MAQNGYNNGGYDKGYYGNTNSNGYDYSQQPGLELAPDGSKNAPQVAMAESSPLPQYVPPGEESHYHHSMKYYQAPQEDPQDTRALPPTPAEKPRRKLLWWAIGGVVILLVIIGAVVGGLYGSGVLGTKSSSQQNSNESGSPTITRPPNGDTPSPTSSEPSTTASLETSIPTAYGIEQSIRRGSALSAASWTTPQGNTEVYLFHQDADNLIRYSRFDSGRSTSALNGTNWEEPQVVVSAERNSRFSATLLIYNITHEPQVQLYYSGDNERLLGLRVNLKNSPAIAEDIVNGYNWTATSGSAVAAYWPWVHFINEENVIMESRNQIGGALQPNTVATDIRKMGIRTRAGSSVVIVPMLTDFRGIAHGGGYGLIYRDSEGYLTAEVPRINEPDSLPENYPISWPSDFPSIQIDEDTPIAAFSAARSSTSSSVNTYILYRDGSDILTVSTDGTSWEQSRPEALRGVDLDTQIACVSMGTSAFDSSESRINLARVGSGNTCYFQKKGSVREVVLDNGEWVEVRIVPIP